MPLHLITQYFRFRALESVHFPPGKAGNVFRGALGMLLPPVDPSKATVKAGPGGMADPPRPFVLRASELDGRTFAPDAEFAIDIHFFDLNQPLPEIFATALGELSRTGLGPRRARVELLPPEPPRRITLDLSPGAPQNRATVRFVTPTELKGLEPRASVIPFDVLFARARDRVSSLCALYGVGASDIDFAGMGLRAKGVRMIGCSIAHADIMRRSSRTGQTHDIGGFTGVASYEGDLAEFMPYLRGAWWTGIGRHTVWGNGVISCE